MTNAMRKAMGRTWAVIVIHICLTSSPVLSEGDAISLFDHETSNQSREGNRTVFKDVTHFQGGLNKWDFTGMWSKYDLSHLSEGDRPIALNPERQDQSVFICHTSPMVSTLEKQFQPLEEAKLTVGYFVSSNHTDLTMVGVVKGVHDSYQEVFNYTRDDLHENNNLWITQSFDLDDFTSEGYFTIQFRLWSATEGIWAAEEINVTGYPVELSPIVGTVLPNPNDNATSLEPEATVTEVPHNGTTIPSVEGNTTASGNETAGNTTANGNETAGNTTANGNETSGNNTANGNGTDTTPMNGTNINATTEIPDGNGNSGKPSLLEDSNVTQPITSNVTQVPPSNVTDISSGNVTQDIMSNVTQVPPSNVSQEHQPLNTTGIPASNLTTDHPLVNVSSLPNVTTVGPQSNVSQAPGSNTTQVSAGNSSVDPHNNGSTEIPSGNFTMDPPSNVSDAPMSNVSRETPGNASSETPIASSEPSVIPPEEGSPEETPPKKSLLGEHLSKLGEVAQAIWDAFYVFLALFCACLVALVGLIVRGRCKDEDRPPPSVATYNPRTASYRLDKVYDNPGYDTNAV